MDTPPNEGVPVELFIPEEGDEEPFIYGTQLYRNMWDCQWKDDDERDQISDDAPIQEHCNYVYEFDVNFPELSDYIEAREEERERIAKERANAAELIEGQAPDGQ